MSKIRNKDLKDQTLNINLSSKSHRDENVAI